MINDVISQLKRDEGFRADVYIDTVGKRTVGYGHNLDANPLPDLVFPITEAQATQILGKDVERISTALQRALPHPLVPLSGQSLPAQPVPSPRRPSR